MRALMGNLLVPLSDAIYELVASIPMWAVKTGVYGFIVLLALWVISLPPQLPEDAGKGKALRLNDLRMFALLVLALQLLLYWVF